MTVKISEGYAKGLEELDKKIGAELVRLLLAAKKKMRLARKDEIPQLIVTTVKTKVTKTKRGYVRR